MTEEQQQKKFLNRALAAIIATVAVVLLVLLVGAVIEVLILVFAGTVIGLYLKVASRWAARRTRTPRRVALGGILLFLVAVLGLFIVLVAPSVLREVSNLGAEVERAVRGLEALLQESPEGQRILLEIQEFLGGLRENEQVGSIIQQTVVEALSAFTSTLGALASVVVILMIALYVSVEPSLYSKGLLRLLPLSRRARAKEIFGKLEHVLSWWFVGQSISMLILGTTTTIFLVILDVPLAFLLGLLTAVMTFVPNLGPLLAGIPTVIMALAQGPTTALYVLIFVIILQNVEGFFITPTIHRRIIALPPALILCVQLILASLIGFIGVFVAMPIVAVGMVLVRTLYVEDFLGDRLEEDVKKPPPDEAVEP